MQYNNIKPYYKISSRNDIFEHEMDNNLTDFSYSPIELYFLLKEINNNEHALVELIISFIGIKNNIYYWAKFFYNKHLSRDDKLLIKFIYPVKTENIDFIIVQIDRYLNTQKFHTLFKPLIIDIGLHVSQTKHKCDYYTYPYDLIRTIGLFNIMKYNKEIKTIRNRYNQMYDKTKDHFYREPFLPLCHLQIATENIEKCKKIYNIYTKSINTKMKQCYTLGNN